MILSSLTENLLLGEFYVIEIPQNAENFKYFLKNLLQR